MPKGCACSLRSHPINPSIMPDKLLFPCLCLKMVYSFFPELKKKKNPA